METKRIKSDNNRIKDEVKKDTHYHMYMMDQNEWDLLLLVQEDNTS